MGSNVEFDFFDNIPRKPWHQDILKNASESCDDTNWLKVSAIGPAGSGKTSVIRSICESTFKPSYQPTVGVDYGFKIEKKDSIQLKMHLWDFSGDLIYKDILCELMKGSNLIFIVIDAAALQPLDKVIDPWICIVEECSTSFTRQQIVVIANKCDKRAVYSHEDIMAYLQSKSISKYFRTSCSTTNGFQQLLEYLVNNYGSGHNLKLSTNDLS